MHEKIETENLKDFNIFFEYGNLDQELEDASDILSGLLQRKRSMYYYRQEGSGVPLKENYPNSAAMVVSLRYEVVNWISFRNTQVSDGTNNTRDRRVASSQSQVGFKQDKKGNLDMSVLYLPFSNFTKPREVSIPMATGI